MSSIHLKMENSDLDVFDIRVLSVIDKAVQMDASVRPKEAAQDINDVFNRYMEEHRDGMGGFMLWFWNLLWNFASQIPHDNPQQDKLVEIIRELKALPARVIRVKNRGEIDIWGSMLHFAVDFPQDWDHQDPGKNVSEKKQRYLNMHAYAARVLGCRLVSLEMNAIWSLQDVVEGAIVDAHGSPEIVSSDPMAIKDLPLKAMVAALWIKYAGQVLFGRDEEIGGTDGGPLWKIPENEASMLQKQFKGTQGLCPERWKLWKEQFSAIRDCEAADSETRSTAGSTVTKMEEIERENTSIS